MNEFLNLLQTNTTHIVMFVAFLVIIKYGLLGFVLSKKVKSIKNREKIDIVFTIFVIVMIFLNKEESSITNKNIFMNLGFLVIAFFLYYFIQIFIGEKFGSDKSKNQLQIEKITKQVPFYISLLNTGILAPIFEEIIFRYHLQDLVFGNTIVGILLSSVLFSLLHMVSGFTF